MFTMMQKNLSSAYENMEKRHVKKGSVFPNDMTPSTHVYITSFSVKAIPCRKDLKNTS